MKKFLIGMLSLWGLLQTLSYGQEMAPRTISRVSEVELLIEDRGKGHVEKYISSDLFEIDVKIDPLLRTFDGKSASTSEILPYFQGEEEVQLDEWFDSNTPFYTLTSRIRSAKVDLYIDDSYRLDDPENFKQSLLISMGLVPGRDQVNLVFKSFHYFKKSVSLKDYAKEAYFTLIMFALAFVLVVAAKKIAPKQTAQSTNANNSPVVHSSSSSNSNSSSAGQNSYQANYQRDGLRGNISFTDNLKLKEIIVERVEKFSKQEIFPNLQQIIILEELLYKNAYSFRYLVSQFPPMEREKLLSLGRSEEWLKGFVDVGIASDELLLYLDRLIASETSLHNSQFEKVLIYFWRLTSHQEEFLRSLERDQALAILYYQPKSESLPLARKLYPGAWAEVISDTKPKIEEIFQNLSSLEQRLLEFFPLYDPQNMMSFRSKQDLMSYLRKCSPNEEREIYQTLGDGLALEQLRPPFYKFFELNQELRRGLFSQFSIRDWSLACFNIDRGLRGKMDEILDDKERYLFISHLKDFDQGNLNKEMESEVREKIGRAVYSIKDFSQINKKSKVENEKKSAAA